MPRLACASEQATLPSAALGLIEKPSGSSTALALISEGDGVLGSWNCGTIRSTSSPEAASVSVVVGSAARLGLKLSLSQPVVAGHGASALGGQVVVEGHLDRARQRSHAGRRVLREGRDRQRGGHLFLRFDFLAENPPTK